MIAKRDAAEADGDYGMLPDVYLQVGIYMKANMKASIVDLRYHMKDVLRAIDRGETVTVLYRGKEKAHLVPIAVKGKKTTKPSDHPACGIWADREDMADPVAYVRKMRSAKAEYLAKIRDGL
jgi:antitoxin (DNA-binding transcriptional repressor) of toxin-antitoxin stability system